MTREGHDFMTVMFSFPGGGGCDLCGPRRSQGFAKSAKRTVQRLAPAQLTAITIHIAVLAAQFPSLVACCGVVAVVEIAVLFAPVVGDSRLVMTDIASQTPVTIPGQRRCNTHSHQQKNPSNRAFHGFSLRPPQAASSQIGR